MEQQLIENKVAEYITKENVIKFVLISSVTAVIIEAIKNGYGFILDIKNKTFSLGKLKI